jgi:hypothetical protein
MERGVTMSTTESAPTLDEWRRLYEAAMRTKEIAPWQWMTETDLFGVRDPETGEIGFISVMGRLGEHLALALYLGADGLYGFWGFLQIADYASPEALLGIPHLQASFEDRGELTKKDRDTIKALGLKFRGRQAWPMFRSYRPGYAPWYLESQEARFLACALEQAAEVALRMQLDPEMLDGLDDESYLVRAARKKGERLTWRDRVTRVPPAEPEPLSIAMDLDVLARAKKLAQRVRSLEVDFFLVPARIEEKGERPYFPHMLLVVESASGMVLGSELLGPDPGLETMWGMVPLTLLRQFVRLRLLPHRIKVRSAFLARLLEPLAEELGIVVRATPNLPSLDEAKGFLLQRFD